MLFLGKRLLHAGLILLGVTLICYLLLFMLSKTSAISWGWIFRFISNIGVICRGCCTAIWDARLFSAAK